MPDVEVLDGFGCRLDPSAHAWASGKGGSPEPPGRLRSIALPRKEQFRSRDKEDCR